MPSFVFLSTLFLSPMIIPKGKQDIHALESGGSHSDPHGVQTVGREGAQCRVDQHRVSEVKWREGKASLPRRRLHSQCGMSESKEGRGHLGERGTDVEC